MMSNNSSGESRWREIGELVDGERIEPALDRGEHQWDASVMNPGLLPVLWIDADPCFACLLDPRRAVGSMLGRVVELAPRRHHVGTAASIRHTSSTSSARAM